VLHQEIVPIRFTRAANNAPAGMIKIPEGDFLFRLPASRLKLQ